MVPRHPFLALHGWRCRRHRGVDHSFAERIDPGFGAEIMGRGKFGPQTGPWTDVGSNDEGRGWWGPNPPFHTPVLVLTHQCRSCCRGVRLWDGLEGVEARYEAVSSPSGVTHVTFTRR